MKKLSTILFFLVTLSLSKRTDAQVTQTFINKVWETTTGNPDTINWSQTTYDLNGNIIIAGNTFNGTDADLLLTGYDNTGVLNFSVTYDDGGNDYGVSVATDPNTGMIFVAGTSDTGNTGYNYFIQSYDQTGNLQWTTTYNGSGDSTDIPSSIFVDVSGNIFVTGTTYDAVNNFDYCTMMLDLNGTIQWVSQYDNNGNADLAATVVADGTRAVIAGTSATSPTNYDIYLTRYDYSGNQGGYIRDTIGAGGIDEVNSVARDYNGDFYITGRIRNGNGDYDIEIIKLDSLLNQVWETHYDGNGNDDVGNDIKVDNAGNVYVCGSVSTSSTHQNGILLKYNASGSVVWQQNIIADNPQQNCVSRKINLYGISEITVASYVQSGTQFHISLLTYTNSDEPLWSKSFSGAGSNNDFPVSIKRDATGDLYLTYIASNATDVYGVAKFSVYLMPIDVVYDTISQPLYLSNQVLIRFSRAAVKKEAIDNMNIDFEKPDFWLQSSTISAMQSVLTFDLNDCKMLRVFRRLTTSDSLSITRQGDTIRIPDFWTMLKLVYPTTYPKGETPPPDVPAVCNILDTLYPFIRYAIPDCVGEWASGANDTYYSSQQSLHHVNYPNATINIEPAWDIETGKPFIKVGNFDTGLEWLLDDFGYDGINLSSCVVKGGWDYLANVPAINNTFPHDYDGHGTSTAGIIAAIRNNNLGIAGLAGGSSPNAGISFYTYNSPYLALVSFIAPGYVEAVSQTLNDSFGYGIHLVNSCFGFRNGDFMITNDTLNPMQVLKEAAYYVAQNGVTNVCARHNYNNRNYISPGCFDDDWVLSVGGTGTDGGRYHDPIGWSPGIGYIDVSAPADANLIWTTSDDMTSSSSQYNTFSKTSAATPHVSGVAALMLSYADDTFPSDNNLAPEDVEYILQKSATDVEATGYDDSVGWGRLNAGLAMQMIKKPNYYIKHFSSAGTPHTTIVNLDTTLLPVFLSKRFTDNNDTTLQTGHYLANVYRIVSYVYHHLDSTEQILDGWGRHSASTICGHLLSNFEDSIYPYEKVYLNVATLNHDTATLTGYIYQIFDTLTGQSVWIPHPINLPQKLAYSLYIYDSTLIDTTTQPSYVETSLSHQTLTTLIVPNPADYFNAILLNSTTFLENVVIELYDAVGKKEKNVFRGNIPEGENKIIVDLSSLPPGIYFYKIKSPLGVTFEKIILIKN